MLATALGLILGSFSGCAVYRYIEEISLINPKRSFCPKCGQKIRWYDNIPVLSYILLAGKCRDCGERISPRYLVIEITVTAWVLACAWRFGPGPEFLVHTVLGTMMLIAGFIDLETFILPDVITLPGGVLAYFASWLVLGHGWEIPLWGIVFGAGFFWLIQIAYRLIRKAEGLGTGDVKLMIMVGALAGPYNLPLVVTISAFSGLAASIYYLAKSPGKGAKTQIPFGPFLVLGSLAVTLYWG